MTADWRATLERVERLLAETGTKAEALALVRGLLAEPQQRQHDAEGRPLCFVCRRPQGEHSNGEECLAEPQVNPSEAKGGLLRAFDQIDSAIHELDDAEALDAIVGIVNDARAGLLAEGESQASCGRLLVGRGDDTYDPLCTLPAGHEGACRP